MYAVKCLFLSQYDSYTMWCVKLILISYLGLVYCRPQDQQQQTDTKEVDPNYNIEIERQLIKNETPTNTDQGVKSNINPVSHRKIEASTREILEKIAEVNKNQSLVHKNPKPNYFHFPFSYSRSQENGDKSTNFRFSKDPFTNPVFSYLDNEQKSDDIPSSMRSNLNSAGNPQNFVISMTDPNADIKPEDQIPGLYIKRKITHYQGFLMPNPYMLNLYNLAPSNQPLSSEESLSKSPIMPLMNSASHIPTNLYQFPTQQLEYSMYPQQTMGTSEGVFGSEENKNRINLEKVAVENIKNIVTRTNQNYQSTNFPTTYYSSLPISYKNYLGGNNQDKNKDMVHSNVFLENSQEKQTENFNKLNLPIVYGAAVIRQPSKARQNWNWPGANLFPIYIRDPFLQMYYAVTNMIEYGPNSGNDGPCKLTPRPQGTRIKVNAKTSSDIKDKVHKVNLEINKKIGTENIKVFELEGSDLTDNVQYLDVEDIDIGSDELVKFSINLPKASFSGGREIRDNIKSEITKSNKLKELRNDTSLRELASGKLDFLSNSLSTEHSLSNKQLSPIRDQVLQVEELEDEIAESEKAEDISISNQGNKKVFSRENTGNGIFIHKLKVRQGGVAIAGPGGIATAGSGGTAIVGPNGIAYTHPDGLAIAGSGTKVVAVDPDIDLNEVIKDSIINGTRHVPNTRVGKVVAVGPVIYYNRG